MARPREFDEAEVLDKALDVFVPHGFDGTTIALLSDVMALSPPSIYAAFGSKRGLFAAVLDHYAERQAGHVEWIMSAPSAREVAERMLFGAADALSVPGHPPGCLLIQTGLSIAPENADVLADLARRRQLAETALCERFVQAKTVGDLPDHADPAALARFVTAVFNGLNVKASGGATRDELRGVAERAMSCWQSSSDMATRAPVASRPIGDLDDTAAGPGRPREFCVRDALGAAMNVFWRKGYEGASLSDLTKAMGITRPTLYTTFGNKETLFRHALDRYESENLAYALEALNAPTVRGVVENLLRGGLAAATAAETPPGCLLVINSIQGGDDATSIRAEVQSRLNKGQQLILARFKRARDEGEVFNSYEPEGLARLLSTITQGLALQSAAGATADELRMLVDSALTAWPTN